MRVSFNWLKEFMPIDISPRELAYRLTMAGVEVEAVEEIKPVFDNVVVGRILKIAPHPNADKLILCKVDAGRQDSLDIVCGAPNIKEGDVVPVALPGASLAGGLKVKEAKIRGQTSRGMLCSERELGISDDHTGIMILPPELQTGRNLDEALGLSDVVLVLGVTPNRPDCLSVLGVGRETAALTNVTCTPPIVRVSEASAEIDSLSSVTIEDPVGCPRYAARIVSGVTIGPSPAWMQQRLIKAGLRPINNVVDVTNYVLIELGHPLHAFDYEKLEEHRIVVRRARQGESIVTLDGATRKLTSQMLVIADAERPVAIAGVMGGANTEVTELTTSVLIESAYFDPVTIRRTSKALGLSTEASYRFERGADPEMVTLALDRTAALMAELSGGKVARGLIDQYPRKFSPQIIDLRYARLKRILGIDIAPDRVSSILTSLGFEVISDEAEKARVRTVSYRPDISAEIDLIEEVARVHGYDNIQATYPQDSTVMERGPQPRPAEATCRNVLTSCGFSEIITFSFTSPAILEEVSSVAPIAMRNPLTEDESVLRTTLIPGLIQTLRTNVAAGNKDVKIFEIGNVFWPAPEQLLPDERACVAAAMTGLARPINWKTKPTEVDFFDMKGVAEALIESLGYSCKTIRTTHPGFHPSVCADIIIDTRRVGKLGELHPEIAERYGIKQKVCLFEVDLVALEPKAARSVRYEKVSRFPYSDRDLAVVVDEDIEAATLMSAIEEVGGETLKRTVLFDVYRGKQIASNKKSLAFSLRFQSNTRTLTDDEINESMRRIIAELEKRFGASLRT